MGDWDTLFSVHSVKKYCRAKTDLCRAAEEVRYSWRQFSNLPLRQVPVWASLGPGSPRQCNTSLNETELLEVAEAPLSGFELKDPRKVVFHAAHASLMGLLPCSVLEA